jgi:type I restriction enzyme R subunit
MTTENQIEQELLAQYTQQPPGKQSMTSAQLSELLSPLGLGWKARGQRELASMQHLIPLLRKLAQGRDISGLAAYEQ